MINMEVSFDRFGVTIKTKTGLEQAMFYHVAISNTITKDLIAFRVEKHNYTKKCISIASEIVHTSREMKQYADEIDFYAWKYDLK